MAHLPILLKPLAELVETAERRWSAMASAHPDLIPAVELQRRLILIVVDLAAALDAGPLPRLSLPPKYLAVKLARGVPALVGEPIPVPAPVLTPSALRLCDELAAGGAGEAATHLGDAIRSGHIEPASLYTASLTRDQQAIRTGAVHRGLAPDLVWLVAELTVSPFVYALHRLLFVNDIVERAVEDWGKGYCPTCGSWPALAEVVAGHRILRCSFCSGAWELKTYACIYCEEGGAGFVTAAPNEERKDRRVEVCSACGSYLKTVDAPELSPFPLLAIADLETMDLDVAAMEHNYARPPLREFNRAPR